MRRERRNNGEKDNFKTIMLLSGGVLCIALLTFAISFVVYGNKMNKEAKRSNLETARISNILSNTTVKNEIQDVSTQIGKSVNEAQNIIGNTVENTKVTENQKQQEKQKEVSKEETVEKKKEILPDFSIPVTGEIVKTFAKDNLMYSETLKEWVTHLGIDIKAEKTTVVKSAEKGKVKSIKNDPRYGLTVVVEHSSGFMTVYSNLLTAEFVTEGEEITKGQTIGTVGNTASFEILDEPHLHFEIWKDNVNVDPSLYIK